MNDELIKSIPLDRAMAKSNITTVQQLQKGQFIANIPKQIADSIGIKKGDEMEWIPQGEGVLLVRRIKKDESSDIRTS